MTKSNSLEARKYLSIDSCDQDRKAGFILGAKWTKNRTLLARVLPTIFSLHCPCREGSGIAQNRLIFLLVRDDAVRYNCILGVARVCGMMRSTAILV